MRFEYQVANRLDMRDITMQALYIDGLSHAICPLGGGTLSQHGDNLLSRWQEIVCIGQKMNVEVAPSLLSEARTEDLDKYMWKEWTTPHISFLGADWQGHVTCRPLEYLQRSS